MDETVKQNIQSMLDSAIQNGVTAGMSILVRKDNKDVCFISRGYQNREKNIELQRNTIFRLYSMTKPITAAAAMILMEQGKLDLGQPIETILPGFKNLTVKENGIFRPAKESITPLYLLNMVSGLTYGDDITESGRMITEYLQECEQKMFTVCPVTTEEFANHIGTIPLAFDPATSFCYGLSADILGAIIEKLSGMSFGDFLSKYIFMPLGMFDTGFWVPKEKQVRLAEVYETRESGDMAIYTGNHLVVSNKMDCAPAFESGGAGLVSTVDDYARFAQMLLNGGSLDGVRIMSPQTVQFLTRGGLWTHQQEVMEQGGTTYSHFMRRVIDPGKTSGLSRKNEYGWDGWLGCHFANFPEENMTILMMQQKRDAGMTSLIRRLRNVILANVDDIV